MKDSFWFQHDSNARSDARILELRAEMGWEGYGLWWALVEQLREATDYQLSNVEMRGLAMGLAISKAEARKFVDLCIELGLLTVAGEYFHAAGLRRRMERWDTKRSALSEAGSRGAGKRWAGHKPPTATPVATPSETDSQAIATPSENDSNKRREEKSTEQSLPSVEMAADAAPAPEKKIEVAEVVEPLPESPAPELRTPGGAADVGTSNEASLPKLTKQKGSKPLVLTGDLADLLNEGGIASRVQKMKSPLTQFEADALCAKYGTEAARQIVKEMANYGKLLANNISANLTAQKWLDKRQPQGAAAVVIPSYEGRPQHTGVVHPGSVQGRLDTVAQARAELLGQLPA